MTKNKNAMPMSLMEKYNRAFIVIEEIIEATEDEQSFTLAQNNCEEYADNVDRKQLLKNAHIMLSNAYGVESQFAK